jgi:hypothetical protein
VGVEVVAADGRRWTVERHFRWPKWRHIGRNLDEDAFLEFGFLGDLTPLGFIAGLLLAIVIGLVIVFVLPLLLLVAEIALALAAVLLFRGTWIVDATTVGPPAERKAWKVRGPRRSKHAVEEVASELRAGLEAAPTSGEPVGSDPVPKA